MLAQQYLSGRPLHRSRCMRESSLSHMLHLPLLGGIQSDTNQQRQSRIFSRPLTRGDVVRVGGKLDGQIAYVYRAIIPF